MTEGFDLTPEDTLFAKKDILALAGDLTRNGLGDETLLSYNSILEMIELGRPSDPEWAQQVEANLSVGTKRAIEKFAAALGRKANVE